MASIAIHQPGSAEHAGREVEHNANYPLDESRAYQRLILVGGGLQVENGRGEILAAYSPQESDASDPLGNARDGTISFALPVALIGRPNDRWTMTILSGAQDDHGGAGIGEFRTVQKDPGEWNGGGKSNPEEPNVYDVLSVP